MNYKIVTLTLVLLLSLSRLWIQPVFSIISDCDETYNYWEPLNLLVRGFGKETWEYSPEYSIRSWSFLLPFSGILRALQNIVPGLEAYWNFYITRFILGLLSFVLELGLHREISKSMSIRVANIWLFFQLFNPGWFHASVELLPSSVAMLLSIGSIKYALKYLSGGQEKPFVLSMTFTFIAGVLGWPFVFLLGLPLCFHHLIGQKLINTIRTAFDASLVLTLIIITVVGSDSLIYGKFTPVSWNAFWYNVIDANEASGPNIFGTEPWFYYVLNLVLNFPLPVLVLASLGLFHRRIWPLSLSLLAWLTIFTAQPHKEERFLYPVYGFITLSAAVSYEKLVNLFKGSYCLRKAFQWGTIVTVILLATSRIAALVIHYSAPLQVYGELYNYNLNSDKQRNVCTGREWYHFPNSFMLPDYHRLKFVASGFDGLLPGDFLEEGGLLNQIRHVPSGMNKENQFDENKLWPSDDCDFYVDIFKPIDFFKDDFNPLWMPSDWDKISCQKFIDVADSKVLGRSFYVPEYISNHLQKLFPQQWSRIYKAGQTDYCIYGNVTRFKELSQEKDSTAVY